MSEKEVMVNVSNVDWGELTEQIEWLLGVFTNASYLRDGLVSLLEDIQDQAVKILGHHVVFPAIVVEERKLVVICCAEEDYDEPARHGASWVEPFIVKGTCQQLDGREYDRLLARELAVKDTMVCHYWDSNEKMFDMFNNNSLDWTKARRIELEQ